VNRLKSSMQRTAAVAVALLIGVSGVALTAGAAAATDRNPHHTNGHKIEHRGWCKPKHPKPTKSPTPSPSSPSASPTPSESPSESPTPSPTASTTPDPTPTPEPTATPEPTGTPGPDPTGTPAPGEPIDTLIHTCDEMVFQLEIPADGAAMTVVLTPNRGEAKTLSVKPGEVDHVSFATFDGLVVTPSLADGTEGDPIAWERPAECDGGTGGGLPVTGAAAGGLAAAAALLLAAGGALFLMARRRRISFTA